MYLMYLIYLIFLCFSNVKVFCTMAIKLFESKRQREVENTKAKEQMETVFIYSMCINDIRCRYIDVSLDAHARPEVNYRSVFNYRSG